jgi:hypothetical protein
LVDLGGAQRSREHRLDRAPNRAPSSTDSRSEQCSEVAGSSLPKGAPTGLSRTGRPELGVPCRSPVGGLSRSLVPTPLRWSDERADAETHFRGCTGQTAGVVRQTGGRKGHPKAGAKAELEFARAEPKLAGTTREQRAPRGVTADREGKALKATRNPKGGCGAKQSHKARAGLNR